MSKDVGRRALVVSLAVVVTTGLALASAELLVRLSGHPPWRNLRTATREPVMHAPDPILGWKSQPGEYRIPPYVPGESEIHVTILPDGTRATGGRATNPDSGLLFLGCSFTHGWAISDWETFPWQVQKSFPMLRVRNASVPGYGTYQSLLLLEQALATAPPPRFVFYGFLEAHEGRNVAPARRHERAGKPAWHAPVRRDAHVVPSGQGILSGVSRKGGHRLRRLRVSDRSRQGPR